MTKAATPPPDRPEPAPPLRDLAGFSHRRAFGKVEVTALCDGHVDLSLARFPGLSEEVAAPLLADAGLALAGLAVSVSAFLVRTAGRTFLVDAGTGTVRGAGLGHTQAALAACGVAPAEVDAVLMTHLHVDHAAGLSDGDRPAYPNAELLVSEAEHAFWRAEDRLDEMQRSQLEYAHHALRVYAGRTTRFGPGAVIEGVFEALPLPGHTPGHTGFFVGSGAERLLIWADLLHVPALQVPRPDLAFAFDADREAAKATRARVLDMAASEGFAVTGAHVPFPGLAHIRRGPAGLRYVPLVTPGQARAAGPAGRSP